MSYSGAHSEGSTMKPFVLAMLAIILSGCGGGSPTAPSRTLSPPPVPSSGLAIVLALARTATVNQPTTFIASASLSANGTLDFGDSSQVGFVLENGVNVTLKHTYTHSGTFVATFSATASGQSASLQQTITVR